MNAKLCFWFVLALVGIGMLSAGCSKENGTDAITAPHNEQRQLEKAMVYKDPLKWPTSISDFQWPFGAYDEIHGICGVPWKIICGYNEGLHINDSYPAGGRYSLDFERADRRDWTRYSWVLAPARGVVVYSGWKTGYGWCVVIDHDYGHTGRRYTSIVSHLESDPRRWVNVGNDLRAGTFLGYCGSSGGNWPPHIHFSIWQNGKSVPLTGVSGDYSIVKYGIYYSGNMAVRPPANSPW